MEITIPYWNKVWKTIASGTCKVPRSVLAGLLNEVGDDLCKGIKVYDTPFSRNECQNWLQESELKEFDQTFERFFGRLCKALNLQAQSCWSVLCNYLLYEFHGRLSHIKLLSMYEPFATKLVESIYHFYTSERMFVLKTLRYILENYHDAHYSDIFAKYMKRVTWPFFWGSVIGQIETLLAEINVTTGNNTIDRAAWIERNYQEQLEVALIAIAGIEFSNFKVDDFVPLFRVYMKNDFGRTTAKRPTQEFDQLCCAEIGAFLVFLDNCWSNHNYWLDRKNELDELVSLTTNCRGHDLIMFCWATLQAQFRANDGNEYISRYSKIFDNLFASDVLQQLQKYACSVRKFGCKPGGIIVKAIFGLINQLNIIFNENGFISLNPGTCEVMYELLQDDSVCLRNVFNNKSNLINTCLRFAWMFFPYDFRSATWLMLALTEKGYGYEAVGQLYTLKTYAEEYAGLLKDELCIVVRTDYYPIENSKHMCIPAETTADVYSKYKKTLLLYNTKYAYYTVVLSLMDALLTQIAETQTYQADAFEKVFLGAKLIAKLIQNEWLDVNDMGPFLRKFNRMYHLFSRKSFYNFAVIDIFLQAVEGALFANIEEELIFWPSDFLPVLDKTTYADISWESEVFMPSKLVEMIEAEELDEAHALLITYIGFVRRAFNKNVLRREIQLPGIVFLVKFVFPKLRNYKYADTTDYYKVTNMVLEIVWDILKQDQNKIQNLEDQFLFNFCLDAFLKDSYVLKGYCELFKTTLFIAQKSFEGEIAWERKKYLPINKYLNLTLKTLLLFIKHNRYRKIHSNGKSVIFEQVVLCAPLDRLNIVKFITAFVGYAFDSEVQKLALQILQNLAVDKFYPMFGPMDIEPSQLQSFFLDKLRDPIEMDEIKMEIIEFILVCVEHQPGLTDAFFNVSVLHSDDKDAGESVVNCMIDFLGNIEESKVTIQHPLLRGVLAVIHKVWDIGGTHLIENVKKLGKFWSTLTKPLYHNLVDEPQFYAYIFGILGHEFLYSKNKLSPDFLKVVRDLLDVDKGFMKKWSQYLVKVSSTLKNSKIVDQFDNVSYSGDLFVIYSWKLFISYGQMFAKDLFRDTKLRTVITETCLDAILAHFNVMGELLCIKFWTELYALTVSEWPAESYTPVIPQLFAKTRNVLKAMTVDYNGVEAPAKQAMLSATANLLKKFKSYAEEDYLIVEEILEPLTAIIEHEFTQLGADISEAYNREADNMPESITNWLLVQCVINKVLLLKNVDKHACWFATSGFIKKTMWCVGPFVKSPKTLPFAKYALKTLHFYINTPFAIGFLPISKGRFFQDTVPPVEYVYPPLENTQLMREWWLTYAKLIDFINALILKFGRATSEDVLVFLDFHDDTILASLELIKVTADPCALNLICSALLFCNNMLLWRSRWYMYKDSYFLKTVHCIQSCISGVSNLILRPKRLGFVYAHNHGRIIPNDQISQDTFLDIYNIALEALSLGIRFFTKFFTSLVGYLDKHQSKPFVLELEKDFYIPKYNLSQLNIFTYGGILCLLHFLFKAYTKINDHLRITGVFQEKMCTRRTLVKFQSNLERDQRSKEKIDNQNRITQPYLPIIIAQTDMELVHDPFASIHKFTSTSFNLFNMPWFLQLNFKILQHTVEVLTYFVVLELSSDLCSAEMSQQQKEYMKRELSSEMQFFADFVKRSMQERLEATRTDECSPRDLWRLERLATHITNVLKNKKIEYHDEFFWALNQIVNIHCQTEDDDN